MYFPEKESITHTGISGQFFAFPPDPSIPQLHFPPSLAQVASPSLTLIASSPPAASIHRGTRHGRRCFGFESRSCIVPHRRPPPSNGAMLVKTPDSWELAVSVSIRTSYGTFRVANNHGPLLAYAHPQKPPLIHQGDYSAALWVKLVQHVRMKSYAGVNQYRRFAEGSLRSFPRSASHLCICIGSYSIHQPRGAPHRRAAGAWHVLPASRRSLGTPPVLKRGKAEWGSTGTGIVSHGRAMEVMRMDAIPVRLGNLPDISRRLSRAIFDVVVSTDQQGDTMKLVRNGPDVVMDD
ncbi:hypothetical protein F5144DRAFT_310185 [Chaetomium tenue]|uniref:Uncharacterized protein n=1 Tax=Chaetomium tenue TaxID=1854479 RepID=A0ACB7P357_9PEZI|nr:hypothetical protein F5144DRAFT_310185 [Chaetomium globosum]